MGKTSTTTAENLADTETAPEVVDTVEGGAGDDTISSDLDPTDPAVTGIPRDERYDSIDRNTGVLTDEAVALRAERAKGGAE